LGLVRALCGDAFVAEANPDDDVMNKRCSTCPMGRDVADCNSGCCPVGTDDAAHPAKAQDCVQVVSFLAWDLGSILNDDQSAFLNCLALGRVTVHVGQDLTPAMGHHAMQLRRGSREEWHWGALRHELDAYLLTLFRLEQRARLTDEHEEAIRDWELVQAKLYALKHGEGLFGFILATVGRYPKSFLPLFRLFVPRGENAEARLFSRIEIMKRVCYPSFCE